MYGIYAMQKSPNDGQIEKACLTNKIYAKKTDNEGNIEKHQGSFVEVILVEIAD